MDNEMQNLALATQDWAWKYRSVKKLKKLKMQSKTYNDNKEEITWHDTANRVGMLIEKMNEYNTINACLKLGYGHNWKFSGLYFPIFKSDDIWSKEKYHFQKCKAVLPHYFLHVKESPS
jgi:hypothetical protein